ncbi:MAG: hypothetical protein CMH98_13855 [Oceanospirillaceae bacterium]|nr:hypothetical protein [Oceanospirillaceae bacterium]
MQSIPSKAALGTMKVRAQVVSVDGIDPDPDIAGGYVVRVRVPGYWNDIPDEDLPPCDFELPLGARDNAGQIVPVSVDDWVWIEFDGCDTRKPIITGACYRAPGTIPHLPHEFFKGESQLQHKRHTDEPAAITGDRPAVATINGMTMEYAEDADGNSAWRLTHRASGTAMEISEHLVTHSEGDSFRSSVGDTTENVGGALKIVVTGDVGISAENVNIETTGDFVVKTGGAIKLN